MEHGILNASNDPLKLMKTGNSISLYNALQNRYYTLFVDIRSSKDYQNNHLIAPSLNIPLEQYKNDSNNYPSNQYIHSLIQSYKAKQKKNYLIANVYYFSDHDLLSSKQYKNALLSIHKSMIELNICRQSNAHYLITDSLHIFAEKFPFLMGKKKKAMINQLPGCIKIEREDYGYPNLILDDDGLFLGDANHAMSKEILIDLRITHIVNCTLSIACKFENKIEYFQIPVHDDYKQQIEKYFESATAFIHDALNVGSNRVLVHCQAGISRSATITIAYLMKYKAMKYQDAYKHVRQRRVQIAPNKDFVKKLKQFETKLFGTEQKQKQNALKLPTKIKKNINVRPKFEDEKNEGMFFMKSSQQFFQFVAANHMQKYRQIALKT